MFLLLLLPYCIYKLIIFPLNKHSKKRLTLLVALRGNPSQLLGASSQTWSMVGTKLIVASRNEILNKW